jgi:hypothetical protein
MRCTATGEGEGMGNGDIGLLLPGAAAVEGRVGAAIVMRGHDTTGSPGWSRTGRVGVTGVAALPGDAMVAIFCDYEINLNSACMSDVLGAQRNEDVLPKKKLACKLTRARHICIACCTIPSCRSTHLTGYGTCTITSWDSLHFCARRCCRPCGRRPLAIRRRLQIRTWFGLLDLLCKITRLGL